MGEVASTVLSLEETLLWSSWPESAAVEPEKVEMAFIQCPLAVDCLAEELRDDGAV